MSRYATSILTADDKDRVKSALPSSTCHILAMGKGQIYHAPLTANSLSEWKPLELRGTIVFGRDAREYEILDDASSGRSPSASLESSEASGTSGGSGSSGFFDNVNEEEPGALGAKDDDLWFRLVEIDPHQKKSGKVVWMQPVLSAGLVYRVLRPSFHGFSGNSRLFGFKFENDDEASRFSQAVVVHTKPKPPVKQTSGPRSWNKTARRRGTDVFAPIVNRSEDPEPGIFRVKTQVGTNQKGGLVTEGGVSRRGSFSLARPIGGTLRTSTFLGSKSLKKLLQT